MENRIKAEQQTTSILRFFLYSIFVHSIENTKISYTGMVLSYGSYLKSSFIHVLYLSSCYILVFLFLFPGRGCTLYDKIGIIT